MLIWLLFWDMSQIIADFFIINPSLEEGFFGFGLFFIWKIKKSLLTFCRKSVSLRNPKSAIINRINHLTAKHTKFYAKVAMNFLLYIFSPNALGTSSQRKVGTRLHSTFFPKYFGDSVALRTFHFSFTSTTHTHQQLLDRYLHTSLQFRISLYVVSFRLIIARLV